MPVSIEQCLQGKGEVCGKHNLPFGLQHQEKRKHWCVLRHANIVQKNAVQDCLLALCIASACNAVFAQQLHTCRLGMTQCYSCSQLDSTPSTDPQQQLPQQLQGHLSGLQQPGLLPFLRGADDSTALACMHN